MKTNLYVGNLSYDAANADLENLFKPFGEIAKAMVVMDRDSGRGRGFGFVEMANAEDADKAIADLNSSEFMGRSIVVNVAKPRESRGNRY